MRLWTLLFINGSIFSPWPCTFTATQLYYRWYVPGAKMGGGAALTHGGFGYIWRRPTEPPDPRDRYFAIRRAKSTSRQDDQWRSKHWKKLGKAHLRQLEKRRANRTLSRVWHLMCTGIRERKLYSIERTPDDMRVSLQQMWQYWEQKKLGVMDELLRNLVFPPQCNAWDALSAGAERAGGVAQLCLTLYSRGHGNMTGEKTRPAT